MAKDDLTQRQARFVQEYLKDLNATQAAIRTGYSAKAAAQQGSRLLSIAKVQAAIAEGVKGQDMAAKATRENVIRELSRIAFGDPRKVMQWDADGVTLLDSATLNDDEAAQVAELSQTTTAHGGTIKLKRFDKVKALELLGRHLGLFGDDAPGDRDDAPRATIYLPDNGRG